MSRRKKAEPKAEVRPDRAPTPLRIIGGTLGGRKLLYSGLDRTRPMKDRVREAVFNLVGTDVEGKHALDLFAGTGALGLEAISRGAAQATFIEQHFPTADVIRRNIAGLGVLDICQVVATDTFIWARRRAPLGAAAWLVFCSPPYAFYEERATEMLELLEGLLARAPVGSVFVVEADMHFNFATLPQPGQWSPRAYPPAVIGIYRKRA